MTRWTNDCRMLDAGPGITIQSDCCGGCVISVDPTTLPPGLGDMTWRSTWAPGTYNRHDVTVHNDTVWVATRDGVTTEPGQDGWELLAPQTGGGGGCTCNLTATAPITLTPGAPGAYTIGIDTSQLPPGPKGDTGDTGPEGPPGPPGADGADGQFTASNVGPGLTYDAANNRATVDCQYIRDTCVPVMGVDLTMAPTPMPEEQNVRIPMTADDLPAGVTLVDGCVRIDVPGLWAFGAESFLTGANPDPGNTYTLSNWLQWEENGTTRTTPEDSRTGTASTTHPLTNRFDRVLHLTAGTTLCLYGRQTEDTGSTATITGDIAFGLIRAQGAPAP